MTLVLVVPAKSSSSAAERTNKRDANGALQIEKPKEGFLLVLFSGKLFLVEI